MRKRKNMIKKIIFLMIILIILILISIKIIKVIQINNYKREGAAKDEYVHDTTENEYFKERVVPRNIVLLNKYNGKVKRDDVYKKLNNLTNFIIEFNNDNTYTNQYYNENIDIIKSLFGDIDLEEFELIARNISLNNVKTLNYAEIIEDSINILDNAFSFRVSLYFENDQKVNIKVYLRNESTSIEKDIIFEVVQ